MERPWRASFQISLNRFLWQAKRYFFLYKCKPTKKKWINLDVHFNVIYLYNKVCSLYVLQKSTHALLTSNTIDVGVHFNFGAIVSQAFIWNSLQRTGVFQLFTKIPLTSCWVQRSIVFDDYFLNSSPLHLSKFHWIRLHQ